MIEHVRKIFESRLAENWNETPIAWDNTDYVPKRGTAYIRPMLLPIDSLVLAGLGFTSLSREQGNAAIEVVVPITNGARGAQGIADRVADLFRGYSDESVLFLSPYIQRRGQSEEWYELVVMAPYEYDVCLAAGLPISINLTDTIQVDDLVENIQDAIVLELADGVEISETIDHNTAGGYGEGGYGAGPYGS